MAKSELQTRAEQILTRFQEESRRPIVIEFAGTPKAGKTSTISQLQAFLKRCGYRVRVVIERASVCPIRDKKHFTFNVWTASTTLAQILEYTQDPPQLDDPHVLILDRGIFDAVCWLTMMDHLSRVRTREREKIEEFLLLDEWRRRLTGVIVMTASPEEAMKREQGLLPVDATGSIMNTEVLKQMLETTKECVQRMKDAFNIYEISTSGPGSDQKRTAEQVADIVLGLVEGELREEILYLPKDAVVPLFAGQTCLNAAATADLIRKFGKEGQFRPRHDVEQDLTSVQALPVVVVRNKSGDVLRFRRKERSQANPLHQKVVIWAGGHVRTEDGTNGEAIVRGAIRELQEELRLNIEPNELAPLCAIYIDTGNGTRKHVAIVYQWRADTDDIAVTLSAAEFFERRGTSLSGTFVSLTDLAEDVSAKRIVEPWSMEIIRTLVQTEAGGAESQLF